MTTTFTQTLRLNKPDFRDPNWGTQINDNADNIDRAIQAALAGANFEVWANTTHWDEGQIAIDVNTTPASYWICNVTHTSANTPTTFAQDRAAHPTYWSPFLFNYRARGAWTHDTQYLINDIAYDSSLGITGICKIAHISNHAGTINDDAANWDYIVNLPSSLPASSITYNPATSGLGVTNVQAAIDAVDAINDTQTTNIATNTTNIATNTTNIGTNTTNISALQALELKEGWDIGDVRLSMRSVPHSGWLLMNDGTIGNAVSGATSRANADVLTLFDLCWQFPNTSCPISGGVRGASSVADFAAGKTLGLFRTLGRAILSGGPFGGGAGSGLTARDSGQTGGEETHLTVLGEVPSHNHGGATGTDSVTHTHQVTVPTNTDPKPSSGGTSAFIANATAVTSGTPSVTHTHSIPSAGSGTAHNNMQPWTAFCLHIRAY